MKKLIYALAAASILSLSFVACGSDDDDDECVPNQTLVDLCRDTCGTTVTDNCGNELECPACTDAGVTDAGVTDAGVTDAGESDAGEDIFYCENKCGKIRLGENFFLDCNEVNTDDCACTGDEQCANGSCDTAVGKCIDEGSICLTNENCGDTQKCDVSTLIDELYGACKKGERGGKECGEESTEEGADCAFGMAIDAADGKSYCSCECGGDEFCPETLPRCQSFMGFCVD